MVSSAAPGLQHYDEASCSRFLLRRLLSNHRIKADPRNVRTISGIVMAMNSQTAAGAKVLVIFPDASGEKRMISVDKSVCVKELANASNCEERWL
jgi:hypothetical protein